MELTLNKSSAVTLPATNETIIKHTFEGVKYGGKYRITIATDVENAIPSRPMMYIAPPILPPHQLTVLPDNNSYVLYWQARDLPDSITKNTKYHYEVLINEDEDTINETTAKVFKCDQPPYIYENVNETSIYSFAVRIVTDEGYRSSRSEVFTAPSLSSKLAKNQRKYFDFSFL